VLDYIITGTWQEGQRAGAMGVGEWSKQHLAKRRYSPWRIYLFLVGDFQSVQEQGGAG